MIKNTENRVRLFTVCLSETEVMLRLVDHVTCGTFHVFRGGMCQGDRAKMCILTDILWISDDKLY